MVEENGCARNELVITLDGLISNFENALHLLGSDKEALKKALGDIAWARGIANKHRQNGPSCKMPAADTQVEVYDYRPNAHSSTQSWW